MSERTTTATRGARETAAPRTTTAVQWVLGVSLAMYFVQLTLLKASDLQQMFGVDAQAVGRHWWSVGTYLFVHAGFWSLALNLYTLWLFGPRLEARWGTREFVRFAFVCAVGGWMAHLLLVPSGTLLIGSTALVLGVLLAYATTWPTEELVAFGVWPVSTRWFILMVSVLIVTSGALLDDGRGAAMAHLGGLIAGWLYLRAVSSVDLERLRQGVSPIPETDDDAMPRAVPKTMPRSQEHREQPRSHIDDVVAQSNASVAPSMTPPARARRPVRRAPASDAQIERPTLDNILDKISASGLESLLPEERAILDAASRRLREP